MNDAIFKFKRYEDSSLSYTGLDKHENEDVGGSSGTSASSISGAFIVDCWL